MALQIGDVKETISVYGSSSPPPPVRTKTIDQAGIEACAPPAVGGEIVPPRKLFDRKPIYPARQLADGAGATVEIDCRMGTDGFTHDCRLTAPADPDQWLITHTAMLTPSAYPCGENR